MSVAIHFLGSFFTATDRSRDCYAVSGAQALISQRRMPRRDAVILEFTRRGRITLEALRQ